MEPEQIKLSQCEPQRLKVLHEIEQGYLTQAEAGNQLLSQGTFSIGIILCAGSATTTRSAGANPCRARTGLGAGGEVTEAAGGKVEENEQDRVVAQVEKVARHDRAGPRASVGEPDAHQG